MKNDQQSFFIFHLSHFIHSMRSLFALLMLILVCALMGCGQSYRWHQSHPSYKQAPTDSIAVTGLDNAFVVTRSSWFAKRLDISKDSVQTFTTKLCAKSFLEELQKNYAATTVISDEVINKFPEESQKLDTRVFMKGHLPEQGVSITDETGKTPSRILIIHEFILGTDLKREDFFDYALIHNESPDKKTSKNLTAIFSYTLWDNEKQRSLYSAVNEIEQPIIKLSLNDIDSIVRKSMQQIKANLQQGVQ